jgi:hypothetical protein
MDDVGHLLLRHADRVAAVAGLADHVDVGLLLEDHLEPAAEQGVVVDDHHADRVCLVLCHSSLLRAERVGALI